MKSLATIIIATILLITGACNDPFEPNRPSNPDTESSDTNAPDDDSSDSDDNSDSSDSPDEPTSPDIPDAIDSSFTVTYSDVVDAQGITYQALTLYTVHVYNADNAEILSLDLSNTKGLDLQSLSGDYQIVSYPTEPWFIDSGWYVNRPGFVERSGGSWIIDSEAHKHFLTKGNIKVEFSHTADLTSVAITGTNIKTIADARPDATISFSINALLTQ